MRLITGICYFPCCVYAMGEVGVSSPEWPWYNISDWALVGSKPGQKGMEDRMLPMQHAPPLHGASVSKGTAGCYILALTPSQDRCQDQVVYNAWNCLRVSDSGFLSGFTPIAFAFPKATTRQWQIFSSGFSPEAFAFSKAATRQWQTRGGRDV